MPAKKNDSTRSESPTSRTKIARSEMRHTQVDSRVDPDLPLDPETGIVYHLGCAAKDIADRFIFVGDPGRVPIVAARFDENSIIFSGIHREIAVTTGQYKGVPVTVLSTGMGTDNCEIVINEIHALKEYNTSSFQWSATPAHVRIIRVGTCGSPRDDVAIGTLAITQHAIGLDNTCRFYSAPAGTHPQSVEKLHEVVVAHPELTRTGGVYCTKAAETVTAALMKSFTSNNAVSQRRTYIVGTTASCSGFYGCQGRAVGRFRGHLTIANLVDVLGSVELPPQPGSGSAASVEKVVNIEMENSCICFLSRLLGYEAGTVCAIIAKRAGDHRAFATPEQAQSAIADAITVALDALILST